MARLDLAEAGRHTWRQDRGSFRGGDKALAEEPGSFDVPQSQLGFFTWLARGDAVDTTETAIGKQIDI
jgi:hypothetical protein